MRITQRAQEERAEGQETGETLEPELPEMKVSFPSLKASFTCLFLRLNQGVQSGIDKTAENGKNFLPPR